MLQPQLNVQSQEEAREASLLRDFPYSLEELEMLAILFREPGWKVFSRYRAAKRVVVEQALHRLDIDNPAQFQLRHAAAIGQHQIQQTYERFEDEMAKMAEMLIQQKEEMRRENL